VAIDQALRQEMQEKRSRLEKESEKRILQKFPKSKGE
jgi:hypothetical protein